MARPVPFLILASGRGSNAAALMDFASSKSDLVAPLALISDRSDAPALEEARRRGIKTYVVPTTDEGPLLSLVEKLKADWLCLAGYKRILSKRILTPFWDTRGFYRVLNVHPSLLPSFPGLHAYKKAFDAGVRVSGVTVHLVDEGMDTGPILLQEPFERLDSDTLASFEARGLTIEHRLYCRALEYAALNKVQLDAKSRWVRIHD